MPEVAEHIQLSPRLIDLLLEHHGGGGSGVHAIGSMMMSRELVARDNPDALRAIEELEQHQRESLGKLTVKETRELQELLSWLEEDQDLVAHRRIGKVDIFIDCLEPSAGGAAAWGYNCQLECEARPGEKVVWCTGVGHPPGSKLAVDSAEAYDSVAHAAFSFATCGETGEDDEWPDETEQQAFGDAGGCAMNAEGSGYEVTRP
jgi:hypothetical protein